jgi:4-hydroxybenzoate polyprenyltransferase
MWKLAIIHLFWTTGLWFYSTTFKRQFLIGNLVIAIFIVLVPLIVGIYELLACYKYYYAIGEKVSFKEIWRYVLMLSFFAGIVTLLREIIKDIEDYDGDKEYGCTTLPIVIGKFKTQVIASFLALITMLCLAYIQLKQLDANDMNAFYYFLFFLQVPFATLIYFTLKAKTKKQFALAGNITKLIMISGVCYLFLFAHYLFTL